MAIDGETIQPGMSITYVARRHGSRGAGSFDAAAMSEGGKEAIGVDEDVMPASEARKLEGRIRELERLLAQDDGS